MPTKTPTTRPAKRDGALPRVAPSQPAQPAAVAAGTPTPAATPKTWKYQATQLLQDAGYFLNQSADPAAQLTALRISAFLED